jgi:NAD(P)-dependent dehydrogenase (short-subunit alcohol dehydrogenase family)
MDLRLKGQKALVTGATKGIGRAIVETLSDEGCDVAICARTEADVVAAVDAFKAKGVNATGKAFDVGDGEALKTWVAAAADELGGLDILVSNVSGGNRPGEAGWKANFEYDMMGAVRSVEAAMPFLKQSKNGNVIFISSSAALEKFINAGAYNAMKGALLQYAGALSQDLGAQGIRVNAVSPGPIFIEGGSWDMIKQNMKPFYEATLADIPLGRMGSAEEVAAQVALLASPLSGFTTGTNVVIDGGITKRIQF